ncbi:MAG: DUF1513 domain-containing protein [Myxococcota bacterium]
MRETNWGRRRFLAQAAASSTLIPGYWACGPDARPDAPRERWVSAQGDQSGTFSLVVAGPDGASPFLISSGFRGHDVAAHPMDGALMAMFGRRPGEASFVVDIRAGRVRHRIDAAVGRRFQGHGFYSADGAWLYTSEADERTGQGWLGVRETSNYRQIGEYATFGIGPHQVELMPDEQTAVVANGGILTRPETGREKLNLATMDPSLVYLELGTGRLLSQHRLPESKASIRHLDVLRDGTVVVGLQLQREALDHLRVLPLGAIHRPGGALEYLEDRMGLFGALEDYVGSVAVSEASRIAVLTSPRGDLAGFWDVDSGQLVAYHPFADVSGAATTPRGEYFILTSSLGEVRRLDAFDPGTLERRWRNEDIRWDNHLHVAFA